MTELKPNGWTEWSKYVLKMLESHDDKMDSMSEKLNEVKLEVRELKTKVAVRSTMIGALVPTIAYVIIQLIERV